MAESSWFVALPHAGKIYESGYTRIPIFRRRAAYRLTRPAFPEAPAVRDDDACNTNAENGGSCGNGITEPPAEPSPAACEQSVEQPMALAPMGGAPAAAVAPAAAPAASTPAQHGRGHQVVGLLSTKDLILVDPEDALAVEQLLAHCGREVMMVWNDTPVNTLFKDFTRGNSHLAFV